MRKSTWMQHATTHCNMQKQNKPRALQLPVNGLWHRAQCAHPHPTETEPRLTNRHTMHGAWAWTSTDSIVLAFELWGESYIVSNSLAYIKYYHRYQIHGDADNLYISHVTWHIKTWTMHSKYTDIHSKALPNLNMVIVSSDICLINMTFCSLSTPAPYSHITICHLLTSWPLNQEHS